LANLFKIIIAPDSNAKAIYRSYRQRKQAAKMDSFKEFQFDWTASPKELRQRYKTTQFDSFFHKLIAKQVIAVMSPQLVQEPHNLIHDDELVYKKLIEPLERFICNLSDDCPQDEIDKQLNYLRTLKQPTKMCHKVLKTGDVLFSCNDCGFDATCVVCIDCFHKSAHKDHNYRMSNTDGGGCCDCGDIEAWKQYPACSDHAASDQPNLKLSDFEDTEKRSKQLEIDKLGILEKISLLPQGFASRYFLVCQACLHYARMMLTWKDFHLLPQHLDISNELVDGDENDEKLKILLSKNQSKNYFTVLFNDEIHTYDHVINTLVKIIKCSKMTASIMASSVSREGRSLILQEQYKPCKQVRDAISTVRDSGQGPLSVEVIHGNILAHQAYALKLIEWIQRMSLLCDAFRVLTAYTLLGTYDPIPNLEEPSGDMTLLERIMRSNTSYWKMARIDWNDLFVTTLLTEYSIKDRFARLLTRIYPRIVQDFVEDDHDHSVSVLTMTTQLYTVPSLVCMLIEEEDALSIIAKTLTDVCRSTKRELSTIDFENRNTWDMQGLKRGFYIISDLRHLINIEPTKWTEKLRENVIKAVKIFLGLLNTMQGMDSVKRQVGQHIEYEPEWETGMTLQSRLVSLITRLVKYCSYDEIVLTETLRETQLRLLKNCSYKMVAKEMFGYTANCIQYDVSTLPVSVHLPLTRFAAALIVELMQRRPCNSVPYDESLVILVSDSDVSMEEASEQKHGESKTKSMIDIMEPSLRTGVMIAQFRTGMWRRNGYSLVNQIIYFSGALMRREMFDRDILLLQECAAMCDANKFMIHILNKFNLINWVTSETTREALVGPKSVSFHNDEDVMTQTMSLGEEFLQMLLTIIGERYRVGVGKIQEEDVIKNEIIQLLCIGPYTRSEIAQKLYANDSEIDCVKQVANLKRSSESSTGKYELKAEFYDRFNPFFYHYSRRHQSHALDAQLKRKRNAKERLICCPPPEPVELTDQFRNLNELLICDITLTIIHKILRRALGPPDGSVECSTRAPIRFLASDLQLDQCLHLIGLGLHEQMRNPHTFNYIKAAHEKEIITSLRDCYQISKRSKDLVYWLMKKINDIIDKIEESAHLIDDQNKKIHANIRECLNPILSACDTVKQESLKKNSELAAQRRERIMAMMKAKQASFMSNPATKQLAAETAKHEAPSAHNQRAKQTTRSPSSFVALREIAAGTSSLGASTVSSNSAAASSSASTASADMDYEMTPSVPSAGAAGAHGTTLIDEQDERMDSESMTNLNDGDNSTNLKADSVLSQESCLGSSYLCILCRDEQVVGFDQPTMVLLAYIQRSAVLSKNRGERRIPNYALTPSNQIKHLPLSMPAFKPVGSVPEMYSFTSDNSWSFDATFMPADLFFGPYISTCGHVMHYECWKGFYDTITKRETSRPNRGARHVSFELEKNEILCPLCECISNATIPLIADYSSFARRQHLASSTNLRPDCPLATIFGVGRETIDKSAENLTAFLHALKGTVSSFSHVRHLNTIQQHALQANRDIKYMRLLQPTPINDVLKDLNEREALVLRDFIASIRKERVSAPICSNTLLGAIQTLANRIHSVGLDLDKSVSDVHHARIFMMTSWTISYTIQAQERSARFRGAPIFEDLESSKNLCLSSLVRFANSSMMIHQSEMIQSLLVQKLRYLLVSEEHLMSSPCCLDIDAFELFVSIFIMLQKLYSHIRDDTGQMSKSPVKNQNRQEQEREQEEEAMQDVDDSNFSNSSANQADNSWTALDMSMSGCRGGAARVPQSSTASTPTDGTNSQYVADNYAWITRVYDHEYYRNLLHLTLILNLLQVSISVLNEISTSESSKKQKQPKSGEHVRECKSEVGANRSDDRQIGPESPTNRQPSDGTMGQKADVKSECVVVHNFLQDIVLASGHPCGRISVVNEQFIWRIKRDLLPFLRSCAIFFYQLSHIKPNETLIKLSAFHEGKSFCRNEQQAQISTEAGQKGTPTSRDDDDDLTDYCKSNKEFDAICCYLNLPNDLSVLLRSKEARDLALTWLRHSRVLLLIKSAVDGERGASGKAENETQPTAQQHYQETATNHGLKKISSSPGQLTRAGSSSSLASQRQPTAQTQQAPSSRNELMPVKFIRQPHSVNQLIDLPFDYSELVDRVSNFTCPSIKNEDSRTPTMCLVCGVMLCSQSYCCQRDLNDLASNYKQVVRRQEESRQQWLAAAASSSGGAGSSPSGGTRSDSDNAVVQGGGPSGGVQASAMATWSALFSHIGPFAGTGAATAGGAGGGPATATGGSNQSPAAIRSTITSFTSMISNPHINQQLVGSCTYHAHECSGGVGVFLRIRNCQILLLSGRSKGCYMPAPYIDDHGETDFGLIRGNPLHLNRQLYERLQNTWMNHAIPEQISRTLEYSSYASNINWHLH
jgi:BMFP domain-containing protein YqiC